MINEKRTGNESTLTIQLDKELKTKFKVKCYSIGISIKKRIIELISEDVKSQN